MLVQWVKTVYYVVAAVAAVVLMSGKGWVRFVTALLTMAGTIPLVEAIIYQSRQNVLDMKEYTVDRILAEMTAINVSADHPSIPARGPKAPDRSEHPCASAR